jgi:hypothetical protein
MSSREYHEADHCHLLSDPYIFNIYDHIFIVI